MGPTPLPRWGGVHMGGLNIEDGGKVEQTLAAVIVWAGSADDAMIPRVHEPAFSISIPRLSPQSITGPSAGAARCRLQTATSERGARAAARPGAETKPAAVGPCPEV